MRPHPEAVGHTGVVLDALSDHIDKVLEAYNDFAQATQWKQTEMAPATWESELLRKQYGPGACWTGQDALKDYGVSVVYLAVAAQHMESIRLMLDARLVIFGPQLPVRTTLELCGQICWLLDPRLTTTHGGSPRDRAARWCLCQIHDLTKAKRVAYSLGHPQASRFGQDLRDFRIEVSHRFYKSEWDPTADPKNLETRDPTMLRKERFPGGADRLRYLDEIVLREDSKSQGVYDYLSNAVHPTLIAITEAMDPTGTLGFRIPDASLPYRLSRIAILDFLTAWRLTATYAGLEAQADPGNLLTKEMDDLPSPES